MRQLRSGPHRLVAAVVHSPDKAGRDLGALTISTPIDLCTSSDLEEALSRNVDVLLYGGLIGETHLAVMRTCADAGVDLIHASFAHPHIGLTPEVRRDLEAAVRSSGARILGTGVLPGMWLDVLPALLATCVPDPVRITGRRVSNLSSWGADVLRYELGVGAPGNGSARRYDLILRESALALVDALDCAHAEFESEGGVLPALVPTTVGEIEVAAGRVEGFDQRLIARIDGEQVIELSWIALADPEARGLRSGLELSLVGADGQPLRVHVGSPPDPYPATAARMIKSIEPLRRLPPGIHLPTSLAIA